MSDTGNDTETKVDNVMCYTNYRIPIYGNLIKPTEEEIKNGSDYQSYYPVIATSEGSCLAIDYNKVYVPIKIPAVAEGCCINRYTPSGDLNPSYNTVIDACDLPPIDIRLLANCGGTYINYRFYDKGEISFDEDNGTFSIDEDKGSSLVDMANLVGVLNKMANYVKYDLGIDGSPAFWTEVVQVK